MNGQDISSIEFTTYKEAIAEYGSAVVKIAVFPPAPVRSLPCNFEEDMVNSVVPRIPYTEILFELREFVEKNPGEEPRYFWRYCRR